MRLDLPGMVPAEDAEMVIARQVKFEHLGRDLHGAFEHVQLRADGELVEGVGVGSDLARQGRIAHAGGIARAHQHPACLLPADGLHQLTAQGA